MHLTLSHVCQAVAGRLHVPNQGAPGAVGDRIVSAVSTDSRSLGPGALFVALRGDHFDGHAFVNAAQASGMVAALVDESGHGGADANVVQVVVPDTLVALGALARAYRQQVGRPVAAITGSNGKTTTKEFLAQALSVRGPVQKTPGNLNNLIGLPKTVFAWPDDAWAAVLEMGMNASGEIAALTQMAAPNAGIITCVAAAHLEGLGTLERVAQAKVELLQHLPQGAAAIINGDDPYLCAAAKPYLKGRPSYQFGTKHDAAVRLVAADHVPHGASMGLDVTFVVGHKKLRAVLPVVGKHNAMNAAAALLCATVMGIDGERALQAMTQVVVPGARGRLLHDATRKLYVVDDCYNANPQSMAAGLETLQALSQGAPTAAVLGDMLELGADAPSHHALLGQKARDLGIGQLFFYGDFARVALAGADGRGEAFAIDELARLSAAVQHCARNGGWILVKGSRGMRLERIVEALMSGSC